MNKRDQDGDPKGDEREVHNVDKPPFEEPSEPQPHKKFKFTKSISDQMDSPKGDQIDEGEPSKPARRSRPFDQSGYLDYDLGADDSDSDHMSTYDLASEHEDTDSNTSRLSEYDLCGSSESARSTKRSPSVITQNTAFSKAETEEVEIKLGLDKGAINKMKNRWKKPSAKEMLDNFEEAPEQLLINSYGRLRESCRTKRFPEKGVSEAVNSFHIGNLLDVINSWYLNKFEVGQEQLELVPEWPVALKGLRGKIDYAVFRTGEVLPVKKWKKNKKKYFYVVEMEADDPLDGLRQGMLYLTKLRKNDKGASKAYYCIISNATYWHLLRLDAVGFLVSDRHQLLDRRMEATNLDKQAEDALYDEWKTSGSLMVSVINSILQQAWK